jgi:hypothetical protein
MCVSGSCFVHASTPSIDSATLRWRNVGSSDDLITVAISSERNVSDVLATEFELDPPNPSMCPTRESIGVGGQVSVSVRGGTVPTSRCGTEPSPALPGTRLALIVPPNRSVVIEGSASVGASFTMRLFEQCDGSCLAEESTSQPNATQGARLSYTNASTSPRPLYLVVSPQDPRSVGLVTLTLR